MTTFLCLSGNITFDLLGVNVYVSTKDVIGSLLQDWFGNWMTVNNLNWKPGPNAQSWPVLARSVAPGSIAIPCSVTGLPRSH